MGHTAVLVNRFYNPKAPPETTSTAQQCVRFGVGRKADRIIFVEPSNQGARLLFQIAQAQNGESSAAKLSEFGKRMNQGVEDDCISEVVAAEMMAGIQKMALPEPRRSVFAQIVKSKALPEPAPKPLAQVG